MTYTINLYKQLNDMTAQIEKKECTCCERMTRPAEAIMKEHQCSWCVYGYCKEGLENAIERKDEKALKFITVQHAINIHEQYKEYE